MPKKSPREVTPRHPRITQYHSPMQDPLEIRVAMLDEKWRVVVRGDTEHIDVECIPDSDYMAYDGNLERMVDLREESDERLDMWLESATMYGDAVVARDCRILLQERGLWGPWKEDT